MEGDRCASKIACVLSDNLPLPTQFKFSIKTKSMSASILDNLLHAIDQNTTLEHIEVLDLGERPSLFQVGANQLLAKRATRFGSKHEKLPTLDSFLTAHEEAIGAFEANLSRRLACIAGEKQALVGRAERAHESVRVAQESLRLAQRDLRETEGLLPALDEERMQLEQDLSVLRKKRQVEDGDDAKATCTVCMDNQVNCKLSGCPHVFCTNCVRQLPRKQCPTCRRAFKKTEEVCL
jgi:hypothetical protein